MGRQHVLEGLLYWQRIHRQAGAFFATDRLCHTLRFEDLLTAPAAQLSKVCAFIGEAFEERMLDTSRTGAQVNGEDAPWKRKAGEAVDVGRIAVWRSALTSRENQLAEAVVGDQIESFAYPRDCVFSHLAALYPDFTLAARHAGAFEAVAADRVRFWKAKPDETPTASVLLGEPGSVEWLGSGRVERLAKALPICVDLAKAALGRKRVYWIPDDGNGAWTGWLALVLRRLLQRHEVSVGRHAESGHLTSDRPTPAVERENLG